MKYYDFLLSDEVNGIDYNSYIERKTIVDELAAFPVELLSKLRHFQPQIGCLNACKICSKHASTVTEYWDTTRIRNVIAALKFLGMQHVKEKPYIVWDRKEHRNGVIFSYLDNDVGNYYYLKDFIALAYNELGVKTRISTVGYSRYNSEIANMHKEINSTCLDYLAGVRLSFTPYAVGWYSNNKCYSKTEYMHDMAEFLKTYRPYYLHTGSGSRKMCVEIRYKPLVEIDDVYELEVLDHYVICTGNYLYISKEKNIEFKISEIVDPYDHLIKLSQSPHIFFEFDLYSRPKNLQDLQRLAHKFILRNISLSEATRYAEVYMLSNYDGKYYAINPSIKDYGNYGINIYPKTENRTKSGYIITERFLLNALIAYKSTHGLKSMDSFLTATWDDVYSVLEICKINASVYKSFNKIEKHNYIINEVIPMIEAYVFALQSAEYSPSVFFDPNFTIDTGIICNLGRAISEFKGITFKENEPLTPTHERNYGRKNSTMAKESVAWRLSCDYNNSIIIEELNLAATSDFGGQVSFKKRLQLDTPNHALSSKNLSKEYLIPGQRRKNND